jgi:RNA polymerase sigma factor (sigma-70 family)
VAGPQRKAAAGAVERLSNRFYPRVLGMARMHTPNRHKAEDAAIKALEAALRNLPRFRGESRFSTWLFQIAVNRLRRRKPEPDPAPGPTGRRVARHSQMPCGAAKSGRGLRRSSRLSTWRGSRVHLRRLSPGQPPRHLLRLRDADRHRDPAPLIPANPSPASDRASSESLVRVSAILTSASCVLRSAFVRLGQNLPGERPPPRPLHGKTMNSDCGTANSPANRPARLV